MQNPYRLRKEEFNQPCQQLAEYLLGKKLVRKLNGTIMEGRIVETECYLGGEDKASHSFAGRYVILYQSHSTLINVCLVERRQGINRCTCQLELPMFI